MIILKGSFKSDTLPYHWRSIFSSDGVDGPLLRMEIFWVSSKKRLSEKVDSITTVHYDDVSKFGSLDFDYVLILALSIAKRKYRRH